MDYVVAAVFSFLISMAIVIVYGGIGFVVATLLFKLIPGLADFVLKIFGWKKYEAKNVRLNATVLGQRDAVGRNVEDPVQKAKKAAVWHSTDEKVIDPGLSALSPKMSLETSREETVLDTDDVSNDISNDEIATAFLKQHHAGLLNERKIVQQERLVRQAVLHATRREAKVVPGSYRILKNYFPCRVCLRPRRVYHVNGICGKCVNSPNVQLAPEVVNSTKGAAEERERAV